MTGVFGIVADDFGNVTGDFAAVTDGILELVASPEPKYDRRFAAKQGAVKMDEIVECKGHTIAISIDQEGLVSRCSYRIDDRRVQVVETVLRVSSSEMREDALTLAKAEIDRLMTCPTCCGPLSVCVDHPTTPWGDEPFCCRCGAEGMACHCNPTREMPPGTSVVAEADTGRQDA